MVVVRDVGVLDARGEFDDGRLEGILSGQGDDDAEDAAGVDRVGRAGERDIPLVHVVIGREGDAHAGGGILGAVRVLLPLRLAVSSWEGRHCVAS